MHTDTDAAHGGGVIESASATTSPDNAHSGPFAYIFTAIILVVSVILASLLGSGLASTVANSAIAVAPETRDRGMNYQYDYFDNFGDEYLEDLEDIEELLRVYGR